ncbi:MAG: YlbF family regulator [Haloarculaceae archaeon]
MSVESESAAGGVDELSRRLGEAIAELPVYERFDAAKEAVENDAEAQAAIEEFEQVREEFVLARQTGAADEADLRELQEKQQELHDLPVMAEYLEAQSELELRLQELNEEISAPLSVDFGQKAGGCCED